jgi:Lar family restriction alleviation protein
MAMTLEPCPFCGGEPQVRMPTERDGFAAHVMCRCGAQLYGHKRHFASEQEAVEAWNRRAHLTQPAQAVDVGAVNGVIVDLEERARNGGDAFPDEFESWAETLTRALAGEKAEGWRPIETAPRDGTPVILGYANSHSCEGFWMGNPERNHWGETGWFDSDSDVLCEHAHHPDAWMPLPTPPTDGEE